MVRGIGSDPALSVLFLCYGNICRSSFAEHYARKTIDDGREFLSSGFHQEDSRPSPEIAVATAKYFDVAMNAHRSTRMGQALIEKADLIFIFDEKNYTALAEQFPDALDKTEYLGYLAHKGSIEITDPYAHDITTFKQIYSTISDAVDALNI